MKGKRETERERETKTDRQTDRGRGREKETGRDRKNVKANERTPRRPSPLGAGVEPGVGTRPLGVGPVPGVRVGLKVGGCRSGHTADLQHGSLVSCTSVHVAGSES